MNIAEWILVMMLAVTLFIFLVAGIVLVLRLINLANEAKKIVVAGQGIAAKADDIVDNVKDMTSVGGIVKTFANHVMAGQAQRYQSTSRDGRSTVKTAITEAKRAASAKKSPKTTKK